MTVKQLLNLLLKCNMNARVEFNGWKYSTDVAGVQAYPGENLVVLPATPPYEDDEDLTKTYYNVEWLRGDVKE